MSVDYLITALIVVLLPGTGVVYMVAIGLTAGRRQSVAAAVGCTLGIVPAITASVIGLSALLHTSALLYQIVKYAGVAYLLYLAWQTLRDVGPVRVGDREAGTRSLYRIARTGFLINILNPKLSLFFLAFLPQFVSPSGGSPLSQMLMLSGIFMMMTFVVFVIYGAFAALLRERILQSATFLAWMRRAFAVAFASFGVRLALSDR
jgi:threonine/homoserine/homoserine lactone efflux protein